MANFRCLIFGLTVLGFFSALETVGADWKFLEKNQQGEFFYDAERITRSSTEIVGVWLRIIYSREFKKEEGLEHLTQSIGLWEINCRGKQICLLSTSHFSGEREILPPQVRLPPEWEPIDTNTVMDALYKQLCGKAGCNFECGKQ